MHIVYAAEAYGPEAQHGPAEIMVARARAAGAARLGVSTQPRLQVNRNVVKAHTRGRGYAAPRGVAFT